MNQKPSLLALLVQIAKIDANLALIAAEEKKYLMALEQRQIKLKSLKSEVERNTVVVSDKRARYQKEEKYLRDEQTKLIDRRKALASFPNYKLQQAAEREINNTSRELSGREEALLGELDSLEASETQLKAKEALSAAEFEEIATATQEFAEMKTGYDERRKRQGEERSIVVAQVDESSLKTYDRVHQKYLMDPMVPLKGNNCTGCYMQLGPQVLITLNKGDALVRCPGCQRIVYLAEAIN